MSSLKIFLGFSKIQYFIHVINDKCKLSKCLVVVDPGRIIVENESCSTISNANLYWFCTLKSQLTYCP